MSSADELKRLINAHQPSQVICADTELGIVDVGGGNGALLAELHVLEGEPT